MLRFRHDPYNWKCARVELKLNRRDVLRDIPRVQLRWITCKFDDRDDGQRRRIRCDTPQHGLFLGQLPFHWEAPHIRGLLQVLAPLVDPIRIEKVLKKGGKTGCCHVHLVSSADVDMLLNWDGLVLCDADSVWVSTRRESLAAVTKQSGVVKPPRSATTPVVIEALKKSIVAAQQCCLLHDG